MLDVAGQDATEAFEDVGHSDEARETLDQLYAGTLKRQVRKTIGNSPLPPNQEARGTSGPPRVRPGHLLTINCSCSPETRPPRPPSPVRSRLRRRVMPPASASVSTPSCSSVVPLPTSPTNTSRPSSSSRQARPRRDASRRDAGGVRGSWARTVAAVFVPIPWDMPSLAVFASHILTLFRFALAGRQNPASASLRFPPFCWRPFSKAEVIRGTLGLVVQRVPESGLTCPRHAFPWVMMVLQQGLIVRLDFSFTYTWSP